MLRLGYLVLDAVDSQTWVLASSSVAEGQAPVPFSFVNVLTKCAGSSLDCLKGGRVVKSGKAVVGRYVF